MRARVLLFVAATFMVTTSGCQMPCTWPSTYVAWNQPGVYESFPTTGTKAGFEFHQQDDHGGPPGLTRIAVRERWGEVVRIGSDPDGASTFSLAKRNALSPTETGEFLNQTFRGLGLPAPALPHWGFVWESNIC